MGRWMARAGRELLDEADILIPVPLHWRRGWSRRYQTLIILMILSFYTRRYILPTFRAVLANAGLNHLAFGCDLSYTMCSSCGPSS
jgi:predicted amidophosphoribosyltransferase